MNADRRRGCAIDTVVWFAIVAAAVVVMLLVVW